MSDLSRYGFRSALAKNTSPSLLLSLPVSTVLKCAFQAILGFETSLGCLSSSATRFGWWRRYSRKGPTRSLIAGCSSGFGTQRVVGSRSISNS